MMDTQYRCSWCGADPLYVQYHDTEWGVPLHDDRRLFELLILEGFQAGLSRLTILKKRAAFRQAFDSFDAEKMVRYDGGRIEALMTNTSIVQHRKKITAAVTNARSFLNVTAHFGSFDRYIWQFVDGIPRVNSWISDNVVPATTLQSEILSRDLRQWGFKYVGPTICYAFMQAAGLVNDHIITCHRYDQIQATA